MKTNLIYHVTPMAGNPLWRDNIRCLLRYAGVFNHKKIVHVATGDCLEAPEEVRKCFADYPVEIITAPNETVCRETVSLRPLLERVESQDPEEITFFAHTKGLTREPGEREAIQLWYRTMYRYNLSDIEKIERLLRRYPCCGCFKREIYPKYFPDFSSWHYAGTFFWFNHEALFTKNWRDIKNTRYGAEAYLSRFFSRKQAHCLFFKKRTTNLYWPGYWIHVVLPFERLVLASGGLLNHSAVSGLLMLLYRWRFYRVSLFMKRVREMFFSRLTFGGARKQNIHVDSTADRIE